MFKKLTFIIVCFAMAVWYVAGCAMRPVEPKRQTLVVPGGTVIPTVGIGFDANYDPKLDEVIPGYKIVTIAFTNNSMNIIQMDPTNDKWLVENRRGGKIKAITNLRSKDPDAWSDLPKRLKILIEYPLIIPMGSTQTVDLLFKNSVNLNAFKSVIYKAARTKQVYKIIPREQ